MSDRRPGRLLALTELVGREVVRPDGSPVGRLTDIAVRVEDATVSRLVLRDGRELAWDAVDELGAAIRLRRDVRPSPPYGQRQGELRLAGHVLDRQIYDARGRRFRRVGDLELDPAAGRLRVRAAQVGFDTVARRLGLGRLARRLTVDVVDWGDLHLTSGPGRRIQLWAGRTELEHHAATDLAERRAARRRRLSPLRRRRRAPA